MSRWVSRAVVAVGAWAVTVVPMVLLGMGPRPALLALVVAAIAATVWCLFDLAADPEPIRWLRPAPRIPRPLDDPRAHQLHRMVEAAPGDPDRTAALLAVLDECAGDGSRLAREPRKRSLSLRELDQIIRRMESHGRP